MANTYVNDAGTWRLLRNVYVNDATTWREVKEIYVNDAGTWRSVFTNTFMPNITCARSDGGSPATLNITNAGIVTGIDPGPSTVTLGTWSTDSSFTDYEIFVTTSIGSFTSGTTGTWLNMGTTQTFTRATGVGTTTSVTFTVQLRRVSTAEVINTANFFLECSR